ncbi:DUF58 domain-containing protein [Subtercola sp. YIM 133946]|uniref:DUF58 domain-containing protein n=1 Tax=Subtercola sp. YIM 133946 TaxID=3118909 RepID=UPI002F94010E
MRRVRQVLRVLPRLTMRGWAFVAVGVALFVAMEVLQRREFAFVGIFVVALPVLAAVGVTLYRLPFTVERRFAPELAAAGSDVLVSVIVRNWGRLPGPAVSWADAVSAPLEGVAPTPMPRLPAYRSSITDTPQPTVLGYSLEASHRGRHSVGPLVLFITDPFGMAVARRQIGTADELLVTPSTVALPQGAVRLASGSGQAHQSRRLGAGGEHDVISRKYQTGDSMRRVNWSATARFGELMVRQDDQQNDQHAVVILDRARSSYGVDARTPEAGATAASSGRPEFSEEFEWAVSMSASIALHLLGEGFHLRLFDHTTGDADRFEPEGGGYDLLLHAAKLGLDDAQTVDFRAALGPALGAGADLPPVFAVVGNLSAASAASLAAAARFAAGAVAIIVVETDTPEPPDWALALRDTLEAAGWIAQCVASDEPPSAAWGNLDGERLVL